MKRLVNRQVAAIALAIIVGPTLTISAGALLAITAGSVRAHHSHAMFDHTTTVTITGTIGNVLYRNPHVFIWVLESVPHAASAVPYRFSRVESVRVSPGAGSFTA